MTVKRGEIYEIDLSGSQGSEQRKDRPCLIIQNDRGNKSSPTTIIAVITGFQGDETYPFEVELTPNEKNGLEKRSVVDLSQLRTISKKDRIKGGKWGELKDYKMRNVEDAIRYSLDLR